MRKYSTFLSPYISNTSTPHHYNTAMLIDAHLLTLFSLNTPEGLEPPHLTTRWSDSSLMFLASVHKAKSDALKSIVEGEGWPQDDRYTDHAEAAAFMIVLHADYDLEFQKHCHQLMLKLATLGKIKLGYLAFLTDRILCNEGHHQRFGTQIREAANGCFVPKPMEEEDDIERLDLLRKQAGLSETMLEYTQRINGGDLLLPRMLLGDYADIWEGKRESNVISFPQKDS